MWKALVDPSQLENLVLNLAVNARDAMPRGGTIAIEVANADLSEREAQDVGLSAGQYVRISVTDTGVGMTEEVMQKAFEPFFTTKRLGKGTGLGLSQVFGFVRQSGGNVKIKSVVDKGTSVAVYLPRITDERARQMIAPPVAPQTAAAGARQGERILLVEDETQVRAYASEALRDLGYEVIEAASGTETIRIDEQPAVSLIISDMMMPEMTGEELMVDVRRKRPRQPILFMSGYARPTGEYVTALSSRNFLPKPFDLDQLARAVRAALDRQ